ncbi:MULTISPECIES: hypothetical protein [Kitasatospora]|uniref:Uncharacterized protein n=1 Tax=Kitasatospora setae (strain ATCC 33774 / DSM 43861 / JCM 3304 / KCC A-0304 / NBRC 14216 / KM-6054) TaxID=452652 RepID=E4NEK4_KITSK|nr:MULTISPECIES: hypothetical protein [Kitasatospora]BAJ29790.1 hypothetical protein KSE_39960 [Kitasatospora setae KM-6054]
MRLVDHYAADHPTLLWYAVGEDPRGLLLAQSGDGVFLTVAADHHRRFLVLPPDEWADLCDAVKSGELDGVLGGRVLCADPHRPLDPLPVEQRSTA